jgi:ribosome modulation factor
MTKDESRAYSRGYNAGIYGRWAAHRPPAPPDQVVRALFDAAQALRDEADSICATLEPQDEFVKRLGPRIDAVDVVMCTITEWLSMRDPT